MPFPFRADFPTVLPNVVTIPAVADPYSHFNVHHVGDALTYVYLDSDRGHMAQKITADEVAKACVEDFMASMMYADPQVYPGLFWLPGEVSKQDVEKFHSDKLKEARRIQDLWFTRLVETADDEWTRAKHHRSIAPVQKLAAQNLGLSREWMIQNNAIPTVKFMNCPACRTLIDSQAVVCAHCQCVVNAEEFGKLHFAARPPAVPQLAAK